MSFDQKDGVNIMKGYAGKRRILARQESIRAERLHVASAYALVDIGPSSASGHLFGRCRRNAR